MTDGCDKQMVLLVVSLITRIQSAMKPELWLVKATQSGDKFIQQTIHFHGGECGGICEEKQPNINRSVCAEVGSDVVLMTRTFDC